MTEPKRRDWNTMEQKREAIVAVLKYLQKASEEERNACIANDSTLRALFERKDVGNINVPNDLKTVAMPMHEREKKAKGSVVLEMPPRAGQTPTFAEPPDPILVHLLCCYKVW